MILLLLFCHLSSSFYVLASCMRVKWWVCLYFFTLYCRIPGCFWTSMTGLYILRRESSCIWLILILIALTYLSKSKYRQKILHIPFWIYSFDILSTLIFDVYPMHQNWYFSIIMKHIHEVSPPQTINLKQSRAHRHWKSRQNRWTRLSLKILRSHSPDTENYKFPYFGSHTSPSSS